MKFTRIQLSILLLPVLLILQSCNSEKETDDIEINAPADFEISDTSGGTFGASVTIPFGSGTVATTPIYVKLKSSLAINSYSGDVDVTSVGATTKTVSLSGDVYNTLTNALAIVGAFDVLTGFSPRGMEIEVLVDIPDLSIFGVGPPDHFSAVTLLMAVSSRHD